LTKHPEKKNGDVRARRNLTRKKEFTGRGNQEKEQKVKSSMTKKRKKRKRGDVRDYLQASGGCEGGGS